MFQSARQLNYKDRLGERANAFGDLDKLLELVALARVRHAALQYLGGGRALDDRTDRLLERRVSQHRPKA